MTGRQGQGWSNGLGAGVEIGRWAQWLWGARARRVTRHVSRILEAVPVRETKISRSDLGCAS